MLWHVPPMLVFFRRLIQVRPELLRRIPLRTVDFDIRLVDVNCMARSSFCPLDAFFRARNGRLSATRGNSGTYHEGSSAPPA